jgi:hypothetical protein
MTDVAGFNNKSYQEVYLLTPAEQKHLFTSILCNSSSVDYQRLSTGIAKCFHTYFRLINRDEGHLDLSKRKVEVLNFEQLLGMASLWQISFECENERARDDSRELLVDLHLRLSPAFDSKMKTVIMEAFLDRSMSTLATASSDLSQEGAARNSLSLVQGLIEFLDRYEGKKTIKPELKQLALQYSHLHPWPISVTCRREGG